MESTANFIDGLRESRRQLASEGRLLANHDKALATLFDARPSAKTNEARRRVHAQVRELYLKQTRTGLGGLFRAIVRRINWLGLIQWIKDNWLTILGIILRLLPLLLL